METQQITFVAHAHESKIILNTEIPVSGDADTYIITIKVASQSAATPQPAQTLDQLYGALADTPLPEITDDPWPEQQDEL